MSILQTSHQSVNSRRPRPGRICRRAMLGKARVMGESGHDWPATKAAIWRLGYSLQGFAPALQAEWAAGRRAFERRGGQ